MSLWGLTIAMAVFAGGHFLIPWAPVRAMLIRMAGDRGYRGLFSVFALVTLVWVIMAYRAAPYMPLWEDALPLRWLAILFTAFGIFLLAGVVQPGSAHGGATAITRHPIMWGVASWALGHLVVNGDWASVILFAGLLALAVLGPFATDARRRREAPEQWAELAAATSYLPFAALLGGHARFSLAEYGFVRLAVAVAVFAGLWWLHPLVLGVAPLS